MSILENELVQKYFGCGGDPLCTPGHTEERVLHAMEVPIKSGDSYLCIYSNGNIIEVIAFENFGYNCHPDALRIPDRWQKKYLVEEKVNRLVDIYKGPYDFPNGWISFREELRELVELVREEK